MNGFQTCNSTLLFLFFMQYLHPELCMLHFCVRVMCCCLHVASTCFRAFSSCRVCEAMCAASCCPTRLAEHVGKADVWAQGRVHFHPGRHGVKLTVVMELIQKFLREKGGKYEFRTATNLVQADFEMHVFLPPFPSSHLEGLSVLALSSPLPEKSLLFLFLLLLLQCPDVLLKTNESVLFVHICEQMTTRSTGRTQWESQLGLSETEIFHSCF